MVRIRVALHDLEGDLSDLCASLFKGFLQLRCSSFDRLAKRAANAATSPLSKLRASHLRNPIVRATE
jgi:hypothetical protein